MFMAIKKMENRRFLTLFKPPFFTVYLENYVSSLFHLFSTTCIFSFSKILGYPSTL